MLGKWMGECKAVGKGKGGITGSDEERRGFRGE